MPTPPIFWKAEPSWFTCNVCWATPLWPAPNFTPISCPRRCCANTAAPTPAPVGEHLQSRIEEHLAQRRARGQKPNTLELCRYRLTIFALWCKNRQLSWENLQAEHLDDFRQHLLWTPCGTGLPSLHTVHQGLHMVRIFLRWAMAEGHLKSDITQNCILRKVSSRPSSLLTRTQLEAL